MATKTKASNSIVEAAIGGVVIGLFVPHILGWIGYGFILLCYKLRDLTTATKEPTRTAHFLETMQRGKFEQVVLGASLALTIFLMIALLANEDKKNATTQTDTETTTTTTEAPNAGDVDLEAQNVEASKPPPYTTDTETAARTVSDTDAPPQVAPDGSDLIINLSGWKVVIKKS